MTDTVERSDAGPSTGSALDDYFKISERGSSVSTEVRAGVATFLVMAYIVFLNPIILEPLGFDFVAGCGRHGTRSRDIEHHHGRLRQLPDRHGHGFGD